VVRAGHHIDGIVDADHRTRVTLGGRTATAVADSVTAAPTEDGTPFRPRAGMIMSHCDLFDAAQRLACVVRDYDRVR
jgi:hypothetical protein